MSQPIFPLSLAMLLARVQNHFAVVSPNSYLYQALPYLQSAALNTHDTATAVQQIGSPEIAEVTNMKREVSLAFPAK
jgi:hypothetical protein